MHRCCSSIQQQIMKVQTLPNVFLLHRKQRFCTSVCNFSSSLLIQRQLPLTLPNLRPLVLPSQSIPVLSSKNFRCVTSSSRMSLLSYCDVRRITILPQNLGARQRQLLQQPMNRTSVVTTTVSASTRMTTLDTTNIYIRNMTNQKRSLSSPSMTAAAEAVKIATYNPYERTGQWLLLLSSMVLTMISVGGITRLTTSGLSMTTWSITGTLPPRTQEQWNTEFDRYKTYPEYQQRKSMTLSEFQYIYFWEYAHRMMGRFIGIVFIAPYIYLSMIKRIPPLYHPRFLFMGSLGLTQGLIGWWMVQSGLSEDRFGDKKEIRVKPLRLCTHLTMAVTTYSLLFYSALDMFRYPYTMIVTGGVTAFQPTTAAPLGTRLAGMMSASGAMKMDIDFLKNVTVLRSMLRNSGIVIGMTLITIVSGALVAGNDAGRAYNTFPKMNDEWFPSDYFGETIEEQNDDKYHKHFDIDNDDMNNRAREKKNNYSKLLSYNTLQNFYENTATVQFNHRMCAITTAITGVTVASYGLAVQYPKIIQNYNMQLLPPNSALQQMIPQIRYGLVSLGIAVLSQFNLGIMTLLHHVPITLGALHQIGSIVVLTSSIYLYHSIRTTRTLLLSSISTKVPSAMTSPVSTPKVVVATAIAGSAGAQRTYTTSTNHFYRRQQLLYNRNCKQNNPAMVLTNPAVRHL